MVKRRSSHLKKLCAALEGLTEVQLSYITELVEEFTTPYIQIERWEESPLVDECLLHNFGDILRIHHTISNEPFTKDKFEYALERTANICGKKASLTARGAPGHDLIINGWRFSLKTQANKEIRSERLHISKFMELGKGEWTDQQTHLIGLREQFLAHMNSYDYILSLRCLSWRYPAVWYYELVEIPKNLLQEARSGELRMITSSRQSPKPGYCDVKTATGEIKFQLYFDGGTERKLQIKNLAKKYCQTHAIWQFNKRQISLEDEALLNV
jgi:hypothetical protein